MELVSRTTNNSTWAGSRGGLPSKIHVVVDANGLPVQLGFTPGETHDNQLCTELVMGCKRTLCCLQIGASGRALVADAGVRSRPIEPLVLSAQERTYLERQVRRHRVARSLSERCRTIHLVVQAIWSNCLP
jgi:transposase